MASSSAFSSNPRRVPVTRSSAAPLSSSLSPSPSVLDLSLKIAGLTLRKGATFHSPTTPIEADSPFVPPQLARSETSLDDVLDAHRRRVALTLDCIDKQLAAIHLSPQSASRPSSPTEDLLSSALDRFRDSFPGALASVPPLSPSPAPGSLGMSAGRRALQPRSPNRRSAGHRHASDSGLGSSIATTVSKSSAKRASLVQAAAVTRSATSSVPLASLSPRATHRIYEHVVKPLLAKPSYKLFHPLLLACTTKINKKDIVCLRDLERTILLLAPERTQTAKLYLDFCLESVRCLQSTVEYLNEREQTRPTDPPYTAGYFIDLVDQIRHYAQQLADAKEKGTASPSSTTEIKLHGGITVNGRPAELVRIDRNGRAISMATGNPVLLEEDAKDAVRIKRSASQELEDEEEIKRSMARRKKNAPPEEYAPKMCSVPGCTKEFKRPCDLTKHEKTHSRPWKCPIESCKYHEYGWPTEKEKDRHLNDKHSDNPPMYECLFKPCAYKSKRDSNRKQHMEKTHGWKYVRTKTNGTTGSKMPGQRDDDTLRASAQPSSIDDNGTNSMLPTPPLVNLPTPGSAQSSTVDTPPLDDFTAPHFSGAGFDITEFPTCDPHDVLFTDTDHPAELNDTDFIPILDNSSPFSESSLDNSSAYQDIDQDNAIYDDIYGATVQLPNFNPNLFEKNQLDQFMSLSGPELCAPHVTPDQREVLQRIQAFYRQNQQQPAQQPPQAHQQQFPLPPPPPQQQQQPQFFTQELLTPHISPLGEGNTMLYTPNSLMHADDSFIFTDEMAKKSADFILYPSMTNPYASGGMDTLFDELAPSAAAGYSQPNSQVFANMDWTL